MYEKLQKRLDDLFRSVPSSKKVEDLKEELMANLIDRYNDLIENGKSEDEALKTTMEGIGDVDELKKAIGFNEIPDRKVSENQYQNEINLEDCGKIRLNFSYYDIEVLTTNEDKIRVVQSSSERINSENKFTVAREGSCINIRGNERLLKFNLLFNFSGSNKIELYIPKSYHQDLELATSSGDIKILDDLALNSLTCSQVSGDLEIKRNTIINNFTCKTTSGDIKFSKLEAEFYKIATISGDVNIRSLSGSGDISATSGDINADIFKLNECINIKSISGDIDISVSDNTEFIFEANTVSGDIDSDFNIRYKNKRGTKAEAVFGAESYKKINVNTVSGDIKLRK